MNTGKTSRIETLETQVVVLGGGGAGMAAAVFTAEKGADVIVLERANKLGGSSGMAFGIFGAESQVQKRMNIDAPRDLLFKIAMDFSHWSIDPRIMRAFLDKSADTIRWFEEKGIVFTIPREEREYFGQKVPRVWHTPPRYGAEIIEVLSNELERLGGRVIFGTRATHILTNGKKGVTGVLATRTRKGTELKIAASQVIIATGGYGANKEMLKKYCPYYTNLLFYEGFPVYGDGINMAMEIGAATEGLGTVGFAPNGLRGVPREINDIAGLPDTIWLNIRGERFVDEGAGHHKNPGANNALERQPEKRHYTFFDQGVLQHVLDDQSKEPTRFRDLSFSKRHEKRDYGPLQGILKMAVEKGVLKISDSLDEMAAWMGAKPEILKATIDEYNAFCDEKHDKAFLKYPKYLIPLRTPPYYAIKCIPRALATIGGIKINHNMEVLDHEDDVIPGLYATGTDTSGYEPDTYNGMLHATFFGFAVNSGRIAGENAAKCVTGK